jgi:shikimate dehydrogenase
MRIFGLIGKQLDHSYSKNYFKKKFNNEKIADASYENFSLTNIKDFKDLIQQYIFTGINVTTPFKKSIIPYLDELSPEVNLIGATNTILFSEGKTIGFNTDIYGFQKSITPFLENTMERALILGTGGASMAVAHVLDKIGIDCLFVSRNPDKNQMSYNEVNNQVIKHHLLIVNTTPLGMYPKIDSYPKIPYEELTEKHLLVDLVYNPEESLFLKKGKEKKSRILNGHSMLIHQAEESWRIWNT